MKIAVIGCGNVAASYASALVHHPELELVGAWDRNADNLATFCARYGCRRYASRDELLADGNIETVVNLTNPRSHAEVTRAALDAGKSVYSEKPLALTADEARELVQLATERSSMLMTAPCSVLSETAGTIWHALRSGAIGKVRLVYGNFDDGMIAPRRAPWTWRNEIGVVWPARDEFEVGCTYEHAGYLLTWLAAFFGPARFVTSFASCQIPDKGIPVECMAPDFVVGCIEYDDGIVARITCGLVAPLDKSLTIVGDEGVLYVANVRNERCRVWHRRYEVGRLALAIERRVDRIRDWLGFAAQDPGWIDWRPYRYVTRPPEWLHGRKPVDFLRGLSEMARAVRDGGACRLPRELGWHITELVERLQYPSAAGRAAIGSSFATANLWAR
jgi:predicted dehydrogenase